MVGLLDSGSGLTHLVFFPLRSKLMPLAIIMLIQFERPGRWGSVLMCESKAVNKDFSIVIVTLTLGIGSILYHCSYKIG